MTKQEVLTRLCSLVSTVGDNVFNNEHFYDCFCGHNQLTAASFRFEEPVIQFIEQAVAEKMRQVQ